MESDSDSGILYTGDLLSFYVENSGYLAIPSTREPVAERTDTVTSLRAISVENGAKTLPGDYPTRFHLIYPYLIYLLTVLVDACFVYMETKGKASKRELNTEEYCG
jgi:hypothetical protein